MMPLPYPIKKQAAAELALAVAEITEEIVATERLPRAEARRKAMSALPDVLDVVQHDGTWTYSEADTGA